MMKKSISTVTRMLCLTLTIVLALALFAGCKKKGNDVSSQQGDTASVESMKPTEVIDKTLKDEHIPDTADLGGYDMVIASSSIKDIIPVEGESAEGDLILEALRKTQEAYNCTISVKEVEYDGWNEAITSILSGEQYANVVMPCVWQAGNFVQSRLCANFLDPQISKYIYLSEPWWNDTMSYASNIDGMVYAGAPCLNSPADMTYIIYYNKTLAESVGIKENELYDLYDAKTWTWDAFVKYAKLGMKDLDGSGVVDSMKDQWGFVAPGFDSAQAFCSSAKVASVTSTDGTNPKYSFNTANSIAVLTKLNALYTTDNIYCYEAWNADQSYDTIFAEGRALFIARRLSMMTNQTMRDMSDDFGVLPIPLGPAEGGGWQTEYMSRVDHNFRLTLIPSTVEDKTSTALILESMAFNYWKIITDKVDTYASLYCRDDKSVEIANDVYNTATFEISQFLYSINNYEWNKNVETKIREIVKNANYDVSGNMNSNAEAAQLLIDNYFAGI